MKYFKNIEHIPIWNLNKIIETNDLRYMIVLDDYYDLPKVSDHYLNKLADSYDVICEDLFIRFGFDKSFIQRAKLEKDLILMELKILAGDRYLKPRLKRMENDFKAKYKSEIIQTFEEKVVMLESHFKKDFDVQKMSALKFYTYVDIYKKQIK